MSRSRVEKHQNYSIPLIDPTIDYVEGMYSFPGKRAQLLALDARRPRVADALRPENTPAMVYAAYAAVRAENARLRRALADLLDMHEKPSEGKFDAAYIRRYDEIRSLASPALTAPAGAGKAPTK